MSKENGQWYSICDVSDIPKRGAIKIAHAGRKIAIFRSSTDELHAIDDACPHKGGPLSDGIVHGNCVTCPLHNWQIDLATGSALGSDEGRVATYPVRLKENAVYIQIHAVAATAA